MPLSPENRGERLRVLNAAMADCVRRGEWDQLASIQQQRVELIDGLFGSAQQPETAWLHDQALTETARETLALERDVLQQVTTRMFTLGQQLAQQGENRRVINFYTDVENQIL